MAKYLDYEGLTHLANKIKALFVQKETGKGLSSNDYTTAEKQKLSGIEAGAQVNPSNATANAAGLMSAEDKGKLDNIEQGAQANPPNATSSSAGLMAAADKSKLDGLPADAERNKIITIKRNGVTVAPDGDRAVNISVPNKVSDLTNDSGFLTAQQVRTLIGESGHLRKEIVSTLPTLNLNENTNVIYLVPHSSGAGDAIGNIYDEFLWIDGEWELIGNTATEIDLSDYMLKSDMVAITNDEIGAAFA